MILRESSSNGSKNSLSPIYPEKKIGEIHGIHISHNRIYRVLPVHWLVEITKKNANRGDGFDTNGTIPCICDKGIGKNAR
jgi:hypothetical protein